MSRTAFALAALAWFFLVQADSGMNRSVTIVGDVVALVDCENAKLRTQKALMVFVSECFNDGRR